MEEEGRRLRFPRQGDIFAIVESRLGTNKLRVRCADMKVRIARIPGKYKKRLWIREGDIILVKPWEIDGEKFCNVVDRYTAAQVDSLKRKGFLRMDL